MSHKSPLPLALLVVALTIAVITPAWAHGGGAPRLINEAVGPYILSAWTNPDPPQVGRLHVTAALADAASGEPVTTPEITVYARAPHHDVIEATMSHEDAVTPYFYDADFEIPYTGDWTIELQIREGDWEGKASFPLYIEPAPINKNIIRLAAFATLVVLGLGWWFWGRHPRKKRTRKRIFMPRPPEK